MATSADGLSGSMGQGEGEKRFLLLYGSQTGQSQAIAEQLRDLACERGLEPDIHCISQSEKKFDLPKEPVVVIVVSTTGDGEAPDTVSKFWRKLKKKTVPNDYLTGVQYGLLGLGDTNYNNFCNMGKNLHRRMRELGATPFVDPGWADDGLGLEIVVEPWKDGLWQPLEETLAQVHTPLIHQRDEEILCLPTTNPTKKEATLVAEITKSVESVNLEITDISTGSDPVHINITSSSSGPDNGGCTDEPHSDTNSELERLLKRMSGSEQHLTIPNIPPPFIEANIEKLPSSGVEFRYHDIEYVYGQVGGITMATITRCRQLTNEYALRKTIEIELNIENDAFSYVPGDAYSFICPNPPIEVNLLIERLDLMSCADHMMHLELLSAESSTNRKISVLPRHIPNPCTIRQYFTHCADFRAIPKKVMLAYLSTCCSDNTEKRRLEELCSRTHASEYSEVVLKRHVDLLDILFTFPSCRPTLGRLIQFFPKLKPRFYSIASSPLTSPHRLIIALSIITLPSHQTWLSGDTTALCERPGERKGLASGFFDSVAQKLLHREVIQVPLAPRPVNTFHLPEDPSRPIIMIGPGTGVVPFLGFLEHRHNQNRNGTSTGKTWLFFGCRHPDLDYIYRDEINKFLVDKILTRFTVCFSRLDENRQGEGEGKYVQDGMRKYGLELAQWVMEEQAYIFVCGEAKGMARDVEATWVDILTTYLSEQPKKMKNLEGDGEGVETTEERGGEVKEEEERGGLKVVKEMKDNARYLVDAWTS